METGTSNVHVSIVFVRIYVFGRKCREIICIEFIVRVRTYYSVGVFSMGNVAII